VVAVDEVVESEVFRLGRGIKRGFVVEISSLALGHLPLVLAPGHDHAPDHEVNHLTLLPTLTARAPNAVVVGECLGLLICFLFYNFVKIILFTN